MPLGMVAGTSIYHIGVQQSRWQENEEMTRRGRSRFCSKTPDEMTDIYVSVLGLYSSGCISNVQAIASCTVRTPGGTRKKYSL